MITIRFNKTYRFAHDGIHVRTYKEDDVVELDEKSEDHKKLIRAAVDQDDAAEVVDNAEQTEETASTKTKNKGK